MLYGYRLLMIAILSLLAPGETQAETFAIEGFTVGTRINREELERFECNRSRWTGAERECRKFKEWKHVSAATSLFLDHQDRLLYLTQKFDNVDLTEKSAEEVIAAHSKRFKTDPKRMVKQLGADKIIIATWGNVELKEIDIQTRLATIQGRQGNEFLFIDLIDNLEKSAQDVLPIYQLKGNNGAIWTFYIRAGVAGWALARIINNSEGLQH